MKRIPFLLPIILMLTQCSNGDAIAIKQPIVSQIDDKPIPVDVCYVLCDFSGSQGSSLKTIHDKAIRIYHKAKLKSEIFFFDINQPQFSEPFLSSELLLKNAKKPSERRTIQLKADSLGRSLDTMLENKCKFAASKNTCIIKALSTTVQSVKSLNTDQRIWIIVLSDMLEDCNYDFGTVDIDHANYDVAIKKLEKMDTLLFNLKKNRNVNIQLTICSEDDSISGQKLFLFWKKVLAKYHYNLTELSGELPYWVKNN